MPVNTYSPHQLAEELTTGQAPTLIDVRTPAEFESVRASGSHNLPLDLLQEDPDAAASRLPSNLVLICQAGGRAEQAHQVLTAAGFDRAHVLTGGLTALEKTSAPVFRGTQRWTMERQVRMTAGSLVVAGFLGGKLIHPKLTYLAGAIGTGLVVSAATDSCAMARVLAKMPWNQTDASPTLDSAIGSIPTDTH